jgi:hypothetical protein
MKAKKPVKLKISKTGVVDPIDPLVVCKRVGVDPIEILALFAKGDVVRLGLMTKEEFEDEGKYDTRLKRWIRLPGRLKALDVIPANERRDSAKELAPYVYPKKQSVTTVVQKPNGDPVEPAKALEQKIKVHLYLPKKV